MEYREGLNAVDWDEKTKEELQRALDESTQTTVCRVQKVGTSLLAINY